MKDTFEITSGSIVISDPCYKNPSNELENCKNGRYKFWANKDEKGYIKEIGFINVECEYSLEFYEYLKEIKIPVDSGQVGVFDRTFYRDNDVITDEDRGPAAGVCDDEPFYHACNTHTLGEEGFGTLTKGAVGSSGYGDGLYYGNIYKDNKTDLIIGGNVTFIEDSCDHCDNCCGSYLKVLGFRKDLPLINGSIINMCMLYFLSGKSDKVHLLKYIYSYISNKVFSRSTDTGLIKWCTGIQNNIDPPMLNINYEGIPKNIILNIIYKETMENMYVDKLTEDHIFSKSELKYLGIGAYDNVANLVLLPYYSNSKKSNMSAISFYEKSIYNKQLLIDLPKKPNGRRI